ncbi:aminotransferase class III-fold pyridoxal phosphate-dependent enzyme [Pseudoteredinibacter isoporae]|uniref:Adenosylmethionine-8-amino-7-oxononanoate aminotransferase n=1 Tax=Pseudoteredinibacter isoporae TaxID=570281 RepID=A0A7X0MUV4_9GAMM|nr:aminotransferase class III-fold pyridoxal phosphate-dependent enzyme [Pseudoteredinibacter isoporae]MBB6521071.1 adenosylmethionine-8-amino-7-oxononanoate aminotransferase [Pseudoteredinibacter isoporae]NHO86635.1 aminotransferase class III-fold pyridoxal phosphate-dependent enzyme [Pseudoteredinibacter isoporae]NIB24913.1 aminotransferase class III-fold pyridoxal phosphate-dependent enzyme [Pseudoteredinibacter isoporae]
MSTYSENFWHPMLHPNEIKQREAIHIVRGDGVYIYDDKEKQLLDAVAGLWCVNVGHGHPQMKAAITQQLDELEYFQLFDGISHPRATEMADKLIAMSAQENMKKAFFTSGGSDSVETALKLARQYHILRGEADRKKFISLKNAYHGVHFGGASVNGLNVFRRNYEPMLSGTFHVDAPWTYRNPWNCEDPDQLAEFCIQQLISEIEHQMPDTIAAFIAEPVMGAGGVIVPPEKYWPRLREVCDHYGILLIADEVVTGFGRSGSMFGSRGWGVAPDIMCLAKGISSGYVPLGAVLVNQKVEQAWESNNDFNGVIMTGYTYSGHPLACAAGLAALDIVETQNLPENAKQQGAYLLENLKEQLSAFSSVGEVRGKGLMIAIDLVVDKQTREPVDPMSGFANELAAVARREGVLVRPVGTKLILSPPLVFEQQHCDELIRALVVAFREIDK